jgi:hypothetical protein
MFNALLLQGLVTPYGRTEILLVTTSPCTPSSRAVTVMSPEAAFVTTQKLSFSFLVRKHPFKYVEHFQDIM